MNTISPILSIVLSASGAMGIIKWGHFVGLTDHPDQRSSHTVPVPKGGGIGILFAFVASSVLLDIPKIFWMPVFLISMVSFYGDRVETPAVRRLIIQFACAILFLAGGHYFYDPPIMNVLSFFLLTVFVVGTANFYNFMDGINGIAAITGIIGFGMLAIWGIFSDQNISLIILCLCMALACLGFLPFNVPHASVFMGDVGSILLGFVFSGIIVLFSDNWVDFMCMAGFIFPFYADELSTMAVRIKEGDSLKEPHRKHIYQLLVNELGISHWKVSVYYGGGQLLIGVALFILRPLGVLPVFFTLMIGFVTFLYMARCVRQKVNNF